VGIIFYRAHWLGQYRFIDALVAALEARGMDVLPVFTSSLRVSAARRGLPPALQFRPRAGSICSSTPPPLPWARSMPKAHAGRLVGLGTGAAGHPGAASHHQRHDAGRSGSTPRAA
jgi:hypothetical protein